MTPLTFLFISILGFASQATTEPLPVKKEPLPINKTLLLQLVNDVRKKGCQCGDTYYPPVPALTWNSLLEQAALVHSNDMSANQYFSHVSQTGSKAGDRIDETGYRWKTYGENIAFGYRTERDVIQGWLLSPGHCKNIMGKYYKEMGIARARDYWTQVFATK